MDLRPAPVRRPRAEPTALVVALVAAATALLVAACGVEVPDDVAAEIERSTTSTTEAVPSTTEVPTSDDELEQALIDNGYTAEEARCGAENLRERLSPSEVEEVIEADTIEDIGFGTANDFADALRPCVEGGAAEGGPDDGGDDDGDGGGGGGGRRPGVGPGGGMPDIGDDSEVDVSRSRFLAALLSAGVADEVARCLVDGIFAELDQDEINDLFHAEADDEVPDDVAAVVMDVLDDCEG